MQTFKIWMGTVGLLLTALTGIRADDKNANKRFDDAEFVRKAASGGMLEVELGRLAAKTAVNAEVRKFGEKMVADHGKAGAELKMIAKAEGYSLSEQLLPDHQKIYDRFRAMASSDFDRAYVKHMLKDHEEDVEKFTTASREAKNAKVKDFAAKTLTVVKEHLELIRKINEEMK